MASKSMLVLGVMSGTSADGIDVAIARISGAPPHLNAKLLGHSSSKFPAALRKEILRIAEQHPISAGDLSQLNFRLGEAFADAALADCKQFGISPQRVALIGSHGQTIFHQGRPTRFFSRPTASTLQIGEPSVIAARTGITTVGDFRPADIALGGQGAPLVPFADYLLYRDDKIGRVSLNLGGIANITVIPARAKPARILAFDTGPANILIDALVSHFTRGRQRFDKNARTAQTGRSIPALLDELMRDPYLRTAPPKSTGREYYGHAYVQKVLALGRKHRAKPADLIRAATIFTALSVVDALNRFVLPKTNVEQLIVSGGGAYNPLILAQLSSALGGQRSRKQPGIQVLRSSELGIPEDAKEAYAFALMAYETIHQRPANLPSATGARGPAILGKIAYAPPR
ncbi:MAG: anhydro-N-acetylmuramic acid kinase [Candidatus Acidiferrum sp.]